MTDIERAIEYLKDPLGKNLKLHDVATKLAISALEKQTPKQPIPHSGEKICPSCGRSFWMRDVLYELRAEWCDSCGQKLSWEESE